METRYKSHLYVYLIICGALYVVFSTLRSGEIYKDGLKAFISFYH